MWDLPYATGIQMMHADAVYNDQAVEYVEAREAEPDGGLAAQFAKMRRVIPDRERAG